MLAWCSISLVSTNWPGFTFGYRWLTRYSSLKAYNFTEPRGGDGSVVRASLCLPG